MILFRKAENITEFLKREKSSLKSVGFVPTMGALHEGHLSLLTRSKNENDCTVCSIYVNPAQFNDVKDLEKYPRPITKDIELLSAAGCDVLFLPDSQEVYPSGLEHLKNYDLGNLENMLEGASRPGHFKGVANVIDRFLDIIPADRLYMGQKDFQQVKVVERLLHVTNRHAELVMCPVLREANGLAMSSRNVRLSDQERSDAALISKTLFFVQQHYREYTTRELKNLAVENIQQIPGSRVDYFEFCDAGDFKIIEQWNDAAQVVAVTAVIVGNVRLLDNALLN